MAGASHRESVSHQVAAYLPALDNGLVWDDVELLPELLGASEDGRWSAAFSGLRFSPNYFRPLAVLSLLVEMTLAGGIQPELSHAVNVALHAVNALLVTVLSGAVARADGPGVRAMQVAAGTISTTVSCCSRL